MTETATYINPRDFYKDELEGWESLWCNGDTLYENTLNILSQAVFLPAKDILLPIATIYTLIPSKWAKVLPILFCYGEKGSGKSTLSSFAARLHGYNQTFSPTDTFAAVRNALDYMRWIDQTDKRFEKEGVILCWDNIHIRTLENDPKIYQLLLFGYSRATEKISIAGSDGVNKDFYVFSPKIISSIDAIHAQTQFKELHRRLLLIPHKPFEKFNAADKKAYEGVNINADRLDLNSIFWDGIEENFYLFWNDIENCKLYAKYRGILTKRGKKPFEIPDTIKGEQWTISVDILCTGLVLGAFTNIQHAIDSIAAYWDWVKHLADNTTATREHLRDFIYEEVGGQLRLNEQLASIGGEGGRVIINPERVKDRLMFLQNKGQLDEPPTMKITLDIMGELGWRLAAEGWVQK